MGVDRYPGLMEAIKERFETEGAEGVAREFGVTPQSVRTRASRMKLRSRVKYVLQSKTKVAAQNNCDPGVFKYPLSDEAFYYLGLIRADGNVMLLGNSGKFEVGLTEDEWPLLDSLAVFLSVIGHRTKPNRQQVHHKWRSQLIVHNRELVENLIALGITPRKSRQDLPFPDWVPDSKLHHYCRGWLDGDGSISYGETSLRRIPQVAWLGNYLAVHGMSQNINLLAGVAHKQPYQSSCKVTPVYKVQWSGESDVRNLICWMHREGGPYSQRKHNRAIQQFLI